MEWIFSSLSSLISLIVIIGLIVTFTKRKDAKHPQENKDWYLQLALSKEDAVSQWFLLLGVFFLGVTLSSFNRDLGEPLSIRTIMLIVSVTGLIVAYYFKVISTLILALIGLAGWWGIQAFYWIENKNIQTAPILVGITLIALLFYVLGYFHERDLKYKRFALIYTVLGTISVTVLLFIFSSKMGLGWLGEMTKGKIFFGSWEISASLLIFAAALTAVTIYSVYAKLILSFEAIGVFVLAVLFGVLAFLPEQSMFIKEGNSVSYYTNNQLSPSGILFAVTFNIAVFFELLGLIFSGYLRKEEWLINIGTFFLFLLIAFKYFDWFFTFLDKSIFFIGAGILLLVVGFLMEKGRRYVISEIKSEKK